MSRHPHGIYRPQPSTYTGSLAEHVGFDFALAAAVPLARHPRLAPVRALGVFITQAFTEGA